MDTLIKDDLKLRDVVVKSTERKKSYNEGIPGVVIAKLQSVEDKRKILASTSVLRIQSWFRYQFLSILCFCMYLYFILYYIQC